MNSLQEYWNNMSTEQLQAILRDDCYGRFDISLDAVMTICQILVERNPRQSDPEEAYRRFCENYLP